MPYSGGFKVSGIFSGNFDGEQLKKRGFHDLGILVIDINHPDLSWDQREILKQVGEKFYGKLKKRD